MSGGDLETLAGWLGTFAVHSTCALAIALVTSCALRNRAQRFQERLLALAAWAPLVSATLQALFAGQATVRGLAHEDMVVDPSAAVFVVPSPDAVRIRPSLGWNAALRTGPSWPGRTCTTFPSRSNTRAVPSTDAVTTRSPLGENAPFFTGPAWPWRSVDFVPASFQIRATPSSETVSTSLPPGEKHAPSICHPNSRNVPAPSPSGSHTRAVPSSDVVSSSR